MTLRVNGKPVVATKTSNSYLELERPWQSGDRVEVSLPMKFHTVPLPGDVSVQAMMYGPLVLAGAMGREGLTERMIYGPMTPAQPDNEPAPAMPEIVAGDSNWVEKNGEPLRFKTAGQAAPMEVKPLAHIFDERYSVYWKVRGKA
jgi:hypothetical protein